jgi:hypothetical protein
MCLDTALSIESNPFHESHPEQGELGSNWCMTKGNPPRVHTNCTHPHDQASLGTLLSVSCNTRGTQILVSSLFILLLPATSAFDIY